MKKLLILYLVYSQFLEVSAQAFENRPSFSAIIVKDVEISHKWYQSLLNMNVKNNIVDTAAGNKIVILESDSYTLELLELKGALNSKNLLEGQTNGTQIQGHFKIGFTIIDMDSLINHLIQLKIKVPEVWTDPITKERNFLITDPDGNLIQFFEELEMKPEKRAHHEMIYDEANKSVLMIGGSTPLNGGKSFQFFNDIWRYNKSGWNKITSAGDERSGIRLAYDAKRNKIYSFGGFTANNQSSGQLRVLENNKWKVITDLPEMKAAESGFVYDIDKDKFFVFGGSSEQGKVNDITFEWDGKSWQKLECKGPEGRQAFVMVYDSNRKKTVLYGGANGKGETFNDGVWEFDGKNWKNIITESSPGERISPGYAFDSKRNLFILFGGISKGEFMNDLWAWDGKEWKQLSSEGPAKRVMGYLAYDKNRDKIVLFGGRLGWPNDANDTWEWDGIKWLEITNN